MIVYFVPFACSLAARIALDEAGIAAEFVQVVPGGPAPDGFDGASPMGYVPAIRTAGGTVLSEGPAVLQYIADLAPGSGLAPAPDSPERPVLQQWLNFVSSEVHKAVFAPLMTSAAPNGARIWARALADKRFTLLSGRFETRPYLMGDRFSVADAYLLSTLNWCEYAGIDLAAWPVLHAWRTRVRTRASVARAMATEMPLRKAA